MAAGPRFAFLPPEEAPPPLFELDVDKGVGAEAEDAFRDDLFESISEAHYLPELEGHDEALLESLVEKGCEDNQILGRLDRLSALAPDELPVADIIGRLESLESPSRSAAQGLLHLHSLPPPCRRPGAADAFLPEDVFGPEPARAPSPAPPAPPADGERRLRSDGEPAAVMYTEQLPDLADGFDYEEYEHMARAPDVTPLLTDATSSQEAVRAAPDPDAEPKPAREPDDHDLIDLKLDILEGDIDGIDFKLEEQELKHFKKEEPKEILELPTDLSAVVEIEDEPAPPALPSTELPAALHSLAFVESEASDKNDDLPKDLSMPRRVSSSFASPRRIDIPRAPSRESDAMQSPQPSGIPAISSPEVFNNSASRSKNTFLEMLYASSPSSPKMYTSEVTIQPCVPLNLGKHRKSASPTVSSCSDDIRNVHKEPGEPQEKRVRRESHDLAKICNLLKKCGENKLAEAKKKKLSEIEQLPPLKQLELLKSNKNFNLPDHILVPRDRLNRIITAPGKEIPALLMERPQLNMSEILQDPNFIGDPELMVISLEQIRQLIIHNDPAQTKPYADKSRKPSESEYPREHPREPSGRPASKHSDHGKATSSERNVTPGAEGGARGPPGLGHLADDIDAANSASAYPMSGWLPAYLSTVSHIHQLEAAAACSQNSDFLKAFGSAGAGGGAGAYGGPPYPGLSNVFHPSRFMGLPNMPLMAPLEYENRMLAMWHEAAAHAHRHKPPEHKDGEFASPYAQAPQRQTAGKRGAPARGSYPSPLPFYVPRAPAPPEPEAHFANNNYLQSTKQAEARGSSPRPRISVKSLQELQHSARAAAARRAAPDPPAPEVGSTTSGEAPSLSQDPAPFPIWHPLFSNQKGYTSPWSWTTVTATGD